MLRVPCAVLVVALMVSACMWEEAYEECGFPVAQRDLCLKDSDDTPQETSTKESSNCVIKNHPSCPDSFCVSYRGSPGFCSAPCLTDSDCPEGGICQAFALDCKKNEKGESICLKLCVKPSLVEEK